MKRSGFRLTSLLLSVLILSLLFSGCLKVLPAARESDVTPEGIIDANYLTSLTADSTFVIISSAATGGMSISGTTASTSVRRKNSTTSGPIRTA